MSTTADITPGLRSLIQSLFPGADVARAELLGPDTGHHLTQTEKGTGYGRPVRILVRDVRDGAERTVVLHTALANEFGHDRRADRAEEMLLTWDTISKIPSHVSALDIGAITKDGRYRSLREAEEFYLLTSWAEGTPYAEDLRRIAETGVRTALDTARCDALVRYLVHLHSAREDNPVAYQRAVRDLVGHGEGIFGIIDAYGTETPTASPERLAAIEHKCLDWRWKLKGREARLRRTHGDFHPFNVVFRDGVELAVLDVSRGGKGDPADDLAAMAINYIFFVVERPNAWAKGLGPLWYQFWDSYLARSGDTELLDVVAPFLAWRGLVVACPKFYPHLSSAARHMLMGFVEQVLAAKRFDPKLAEELFP